MKITDVRVTPVAFRDPPVLNASGVHVAYALRAIIEVETDTGHVGLGETYGDLPILQNLEKVRAALVGLSPFDLNGLKRAVRAHIKTDLSQGFANLNPGTHAAKAGTNVFGAYEVAFLDAQAQIVGVPLVELLGGRCRDEVAYSAYLFFKQEKHLDDPYPADDWGPILTAEQLVGSARRMVRDYGFKSIKLKAGALDPDYEAECILALREAFPGYPLRIDPNANWRLETGRRIAARLKGVLEYYEDPVPGLAQMAQLHRETGVKMATNMVVTSMDEFRENVQLNGAQVILSDHHFWGGLLATRQLAQMCETFGYELSMHSNSHLGISLMAMTHVAASIPNLHFACDTHYPWKTEDLVEGGPVPFVDGCVRLTDAPGLGVKLDRAKLAELHRQYLDCGMRVTSEQGAYMRRYDPSFPLEKPRF
ncbi:glucarate dehydratase family protein [Achromobacter aloeverae]